MNRFFKLDLLTRSVALFFHMFGDHIHTFHDEFVILGESTEYFCLNRSSFFDTIFIGLDFETIFSRDDADSVSGMYFHFFHKS